MDPSIEFETTDLKNQLFTKIEWPVSLGDKPGEGFKKEISRILPTFDERFSPRNEMGLQRRELLKAMFRNILGRDINKTLSEDKEISWAEVQRRVRRVVQGFSLNRREAMGMGPEDLVTKAKKLVEGTRRDWQGTDEALALKGGLVNEFFQGRIERVVDYIKALEGRGAVSSKDLPLFEVMHRLASRAKKEKGFKEGFFNKIALLQGTDELEEKIEEIRGGGEKNHG